MNTRKAPSIKKTEQSRFNNCTNLNAFNGDLIWLIIIVLAFVFWFGTDTGFSD